MPEGMRVSLGAQVALHTPGYSPCTSRCSCTIRDLYSPHFSYRVCCKRPHPHLTVRSQQETNRRWVQTDGLGNTEETLRFKGGSDR